MTQGNYYAAQTTRLEQRLWAEVTNQSPSRSAPSLEAIKDSDGYADGVQADSVDFSFEGMKNVVKVLSKIFNATHGLRIRPAQRSVWMLRPGDPMLSKSIDVHRDDKLPWDLQTVRLAC